MLRVNHAPFNIQHSTFNIQHSTPMVFIPHPSYLIPHTSYLMPHTSFLIPHASYFMPDASCPFHPFKHLIVLAVHAESRVDLLRGDVASIDVETNAANMRLRLDDLFHVLVQTGVDALTPILRTHVDALNPPHHAAAPI